MCCKNKGRESLYCKTLITISMKKKHTAAILTIGDELLIGQTVNTNAAFLGRWFSNHGIEVIETRTVRDKHDEMLEAINSLLKKAEWLVTTGGLGPTEDDKTKAAIVEVFNDELVYCPELERHVLEWIKQFGINEGRLPEYAYMVPAHAKLFFNDQGTAPGILMRSGDRKLISLPGVPVEMRHLIRDKIERYLDSHYAWYPILKTTILTVGADEPEVERRIEKIRNRLPRDLSLAFLPHLGIVKLRLTLQGRKADAEGKSRLNEIAVLIENALGDIVFGRDEETLSGAVGKLLKERAMMVGTAESCTGGYIAHRITKVPGSSEYYRGSVVSYSNEVKSSCLGVAPQSLASEGAVSKAVALQMAEGAVRKLDVDVAVSTTGIAGPAGGTAEKPVGTVWIAVSDGKKSHARKYRFSFDRMTNIEAASIRALEMLRHWLLEG